MTKNPKFSIVIPAYENAGFLQGCLEGIIQQRNFDFSNLEVIVIDDFSSENLMPIFDDFKKVSNIAMKTFYVRNSMNSGRAKTRNAGLSLATNELVLFLDSDSVLNIDFLHDLSDIYRNERNFIVRANRRVQTEICKSNLYASYFDSRMLGCRRNYQSKLNPISFKYFATGEICVPKQILDLVGGFKEQFYLYGGEDEELGWRLEATGAEFYFCPSLIVTDIDSRINFDRACYRMLQYSEKMVPIVIASNPKAIAQSLMPTVNLLILRIRLPKSIKTIISSFFILGMNSVILISKLFSQISFLNKVFPKKIFMVGLGFAYTAGAFKRE